MLRLLKAFSVILEQRTLLSDAVYANVTLSLQTLMEDSKVT